MLKVLGVLLLLPIGAVAIGLSIMIVGACIKGTKQNLRK